MKIATRLIPVVVVAVLASVIGASSAPAAHRGGAVTHTTGKQTAASSVRVRQLGHHRFTVTTSFPTWSNDYPWLSDSSQGYVGIQHDTTAQDDAWGFATNLGGNPGLWLYPIGGQRYTPGEAEFTYTAPGTTRIVNASLDIAYRNKVLAHHCLNLGLRTGDQIIDSNNNCQPVQPPNTKDQFHVDLADPSGSAKTVYFQLQMPPCESGPCEKEIPQLDPLKNGGYARLKSLTMVLVDDDTPQVSLAGELTDQVYVSGTKSYGLTVNSSDAGAGISRAWAELGNGTHIADAAAPCDVTHNTPDLDTRICPQTFSFDTNVDTNLFPEGRNDVVGKAVDPAGNVGTSDAFSVLVDRTGPSAPSNIEVWNYDAGSQTATIGWDAGTDPDLPTGEPGSGVSRAEYRYQVNGGGWGEWTATDPPDSETFTNAFDVTANVGDQIDVEARQWDDVGNVSDVGSAQLVVTGDEHYDDFGALEYDGAPASGSIDYGDGEPVLPSQPLNDTSDAFPSDTETGLLLFGFPQATPTRDATVTPSKSVVFRRTADAAPPLCAGNPTATGHNGSVSWETYSTCFRVTNNGGDEWTISRRCINYSSPDGQTRQDVGPGYIARLVDSEGHVIVDDYHARTSNEPITDAAMNNLGNVGATNGGLGNFELQYARGAPTQLHAGLHDYVPNPRNDFDAERSGVWPPNGMYVLTGRSCTDATTAANSRYGVAKMHFKGPYPVGTSSADLIAELWFRDPSTPASPTDDSALVKVTYHYRFMAMKTLALNILRVNKDHGTGGSEMAKEPKWGASVRAQGPGPDDGLFNEMDVFDGTGKYTLDHLLPVRNGTSNARGAWRGQKEQPQGVLNTSQSAQDTRATVRWSCTNPVCGSGGSWGKPCPVVCFFVDMRSVAAPTLQLKNPFDQSARMPWESNATHPRGLDGWAINAAGRAKAFANDTTGDNTITTCSAVDANGNLIAGGGFEYNDKALDPSKHWPTDAATAAKIRATAKTSSGATPRMWTARRWELAGWKNGITITKGVTPDWQKYAFTGSAVLFNGWEGARGPYDCEPLMRQFPAETHTYVNRAEYWVQH
jgi:hypothetical protein